MPHALTRLPGRIARPLALVLLAACAGRTPAPGTGAPPVDATTARPTIPAATRGPATFTWSPGERRVEVHTDATITRDGPAPAGSAVGPPATPAGDQHVVSTAYLTTVLAPAESRGATEVRGTVDSLVVSASGRVRGDTTPAAAASPATLLLANFHYRAASDARGVRVEAADPGTDLRCTALAAAASLSAIAAAREALPRIPPGIAAGARWRDTAVTASCAGPVLLVAQTVARYESAADPTAPGRLRVTRQSTTTAQGQGSAGVRPLSIVATGTARAVYTLDPTRGQLVDGTGEGRTTITMTLAGVAQRFTQQTRTQLNVR